MDFVKLEKLNENDNTTRSKYTKIWIALMLLQEIHLIFEIKNVIQIIVFMET